MQFYLISDNTDTMVGMRLAGVRGEVVHDALALRRALEKPLEDPKVGIVLITGKLMSLCREEINRIKLVRQSPLIVEVPDRHGGGDVSETLLSYVEEAIGVKL